MSNSELMRNLIDMMSEEPKQQLNESDYSLLKEFSIKGAIGALVGGHKGRKYRGMLMKSYKEFVNQYKMNEDEDSIKEWIDSTSDLAAMKITPEEFTKIVEPLKSFNPSSIMSGRKKIPDDKLNDVFNRILIIMAKRQSMPQTPSEPKSEPKQEEQPKTPKNASSIAKMTDDELMNRIRDIVAKNPKIGAKIFGPELVMKMSDHT
ncbi:MAG: hypothetical protein WC284_07770 [Candidimonas sp.]